MATRRTLMPWDSTSDATFNAWSTEIEDAILSFGWTVSAQTGQTDPHSNPARPGASTYKFRIYEMADALQVTGSKVFLKYEYGSDSGGNTSPSARFSVGTGTDGAGALTGFVLGPYKLPTTTTTGSATQEFWYFSGDVDRLTWYVVGSATRPSIFTVERTKDNVGVNTTAGVTVVAGSDGNILHQRSLLFGVGLGAETTTAYAAMASVSTAIIDNKIIVGQLFPLLPNANPMTTLGVYPSADLANGQAEFTDSLYSATRTNLTTSMTISLNANWRWFIRYD